jgi:hypothetical protein
MASDPNCRDLAYRLTGLLKTGNCAPLFNGEVLIMSAHRGTLGRCCTSFVCLGPASVLQLCEVAD